MEANKAPPVETFHTEIRHRKSGVLLEVMLVKVWLGGREEITPLGRMGVAKLKQLHRRAGSKKKTLKYDKISRVWNPAGFGQAREGPQ